MKRSQGKAKSSALSGAAFGGFSAFGSPQGRSSLSYLAEPPSFSAVSDPNAVVCFKSILKKDSTTKAKALDELIAYVQDHPYEKDGGVEEAVLDVWVGILCSICHLVCAYPSFPRFNFTLAYP
jgi:E3 ubiquitin-protein ligase listerin